ncbi:MAG TPA: protein arginine kinase [Verrucomicrobia bacterium]|nr:protein arginine kinase [Verrucomicrobiota bacterium]
MNMDELLKQTGSWLAPGADTGIVVSSRIRLARNLRSTPFPGWGGEDECERIWTQLKPIFEDMPAFRGGLLLHMAELDELDKHILFERHLISREQAEKGRGSGLVASSDETLAIMVNEEDHFRLQAIRPGLDLSRTWVSVNHVDDLIEQKVSYAFSTRLGYLTACPTNVGTGMRASVMLHVPGLVLMNEINPIVKGMGKIGLAVRGLWGEGTEATGNMFQVSNQISLGEKEESILSNLEQIVLEIVEHEKNARTRLLERKDAVLRDHVGRAYGILSNAHILTSREALDLLSGLRLGIDLGILGRMNRYVIDELLLLTQPGHLQKVMNKKLKPKDRDIARAMLVRKKLAEAAGQAPKSAEEKDE